MDAAQALRELTEVSSQIEAAVLLGSDGSLLASTIDDSARSERLATAAQGLVAAGTRAPREGAEPLVQLEVALLDASVFVVCDEERIAAAVTTPDPTAGLVFYDLKSCLRAAAAEDGDGRPRPRAARSKDSAA